MHHRNSVGCTATEKVKRTKTKMIRKRSKVKKIATKHKHTHYLTSGDRVGKKYTGWNSLNKHDRRIFSERQLKKTQEQRRKWSESDQKSVKQQSKTITHVLLPLVIEKPKSKQTAMHITSTVG